MIGNQHNHRLALVKEWSSQEPMESKAFIDPERKPSRSSVTYHKPERFEDSA